MTYEYVHSGEGVTLICKSHKGGEEQKSINVELTLPLRKYPDIFELGCKFIEK